MTTADAKRGEASTTTGEDRHLGVLLAWFAEPKAAGTAHRPLEKVLRPGGDSILDATVVKVNAKHKALDYDPRRILIGTATPALTWGCAGYSSAAG
jgi:hypothetical protein